MTCWVFSWIIHLCCTCTCVQRSQSSSPLSMNNFNITSLIMNAKCLLVQMKILHITLPYKQAQVTMSERLTSTSTTVVPATPSTTVISSVKSTKRSLVDITMTGVTTNHTSLIFSNDEGDESDSSDADDITKHSWSSDGADDIDLLRLASVQGCSSQQKCKPRKYSAVVSGSTNEHQPPTYQKTGGTSTGHILV